MSKPNKLLGAYIHTIHKKDPIIGVLDLETDEGLIDVVINVAVAELLVKRLQAFLAQQEERD